ncbi:long-chain fatty acid--CoA ligase [Fulvivirga sp. M361]|uniref:AMP-binding protein n=1 Tax=Fulvivirga sp. M361 TaxID=2594266 RepID=UPI00117AD145|nr:AMP-binding protein [Fulvivirga sp. M361]TRX60211.1 long-chain fatty acid--CoA ligase [Fulvivirga sp. M361]
MKPVKDWFARLVKSDGIIGNGHFMVRYEDLPAIFRYWDNTYVFNTKRCIGLSLGNDPLSVVVLIYFIYKKINGYISSEILADKFPAFCDQILTLPDHLKEWRPDQLQLQLHDNPGWKTLKPGRAIKEFSGMILSSSGTTGKAKYIYFKHEDLLRNALNVVDRFGFSRGQRLFITVPVTHMFGLGVGVLPAVLASANIFLTGKANIIKFLEGHSVFTPHFTLVSPALCRMAITLKKKVHSRSLYISAGERLDTRSYEAFEDQFGELVNLYGSSELGAIATSPEGDNNKKERWEGALTPLQGIDIQLDKRYGEILCHHPASFTAYLDEEGCRMERSEWHLTKDVGKDCEANAFKVSGRIDHCVNRSGFLISLDEIESKLKGLFPEISGLIVFERPGDQNSGAEIIAVYEKSDAGGPSEEEIKLRSGKNLNKHLVPDAVYLVPEIKKLSSGKPDRNYMKQHITELAG